MLDIGCITAFKEPRFPSHSLTVEEREREREMCSCLSQWN